MAESDNGGSDMSEDEELRQLKFELEKLNIEKEKTILEKEKEKLRKQIEAENAESDKEGSYLSEDEEIQQLKLELKKIKIEKKKRKLEKEKEKLRKQIEAERTGSGITMQSQEKNAGESHTKTEKKKSLHESKFLEESSAKKEEMEKHDAEKAVENLRKLFDLVEEFLNMPEFDKDLQDELSRVCPDYKNVLECEKRDLIKNDCGIVVAGETSAGKTTLINEILGQKVLSTGNLPATARVCRIRNSDNMIIKCYNEMEQLITEKKFEEVESFREMVKHLTDIKEIGKEDHDIFYVDVCLPVPILQGNVILVDTPGIGEKDELNRIVMRFLPQAVAFIFMINAANAGGVTEDRLGTIMKEITQDRDQGKMPCFQPEDVIVVTNKWDQVENDSDDDKLKQDERIMTFEDIHEKLHNSWPLIDDDKIFRVVLKHKADNEKEFAEQYTQFKKVLHKTIEKNKNKRVGFYFRFLQEFIKDAQRGTLARLRLLAISDEEKSNAIEKNLEEISSLEVKCQKDKKYLESCRRGFTMELAKQLHDYIHSKKGRDEILNPPEQTPILKVHYGEYNKIIQNRIERGLKRWCQSRAARQIIDRIESKIKDVMKDINLRFHQIEMQLSDIHIQHSESVPPMEAVTLLGIGLLLAPFSITAGLVVALVFAPLTSFFGLGEKWKTKKAHEIYDHYISSLTFEELNRSFDNVFGQRYINFISNLFDNIIAKELDSHRHIYDRLKEQYKSIKTKEHKLEKLRGIIESIQGEIVQLSMFLNKMTV